MASTVIRGAQIKDSTVQRHDLDTSTVGQAVVTKLVQGSGVTLSSTGADSGTGDVTVTVSNVPGGFVTKTAAYTLTAVDSGKYVICSGGSWTLTLPAPVSGLTYQVRNDMGISGTTGTITITPPSGTIDGLSSIALLPQQECVIVCDGTNWRSFGLKREVILGTVDITTATASQTILLPVGYRYFELELDQVAMDTDGSYIFFQLSTNGGSTWLTGAAAYYEGIVYDATVSSLSYSPTAQAYGSLTCAQATLAGNSASGISRLRLFPGSASAIPSWSAISAGWRVSDNRMKIYYNHGFANSIGLINALKYYANTGNIARSFLTVKGVV